MLDLQWSRLVMVFSKRQKCKLWEKHGKNLEHIGCISRWHRHMRIESWVWPQDMDRWGCFANTIEIVYCSDFCDGQGFYILRARSPSKTCAFGCNWVELWAYFLAQDFKHDLVIFFFVSLSLSDCFPLPWSSSLSCVFLVLPGVIGFHCSSAAIRFWPTVVRACHSNFLSYCSSWPWCHQRDLLWSVCGVAVG